MTVENYKRICRWYDPSPRGCTGWYLAPRVIVCFTCPHWVMPKEWAKFEKKVVVT